MSFFLMKLQASRPRTAHSPCCFLSQWTGSMGDHPISNKGGCTFNPQELEKFLENVCGTGSHCDANPSPIFFAEDFISLFLAFIDNFPKWSDTL